MIFSLGGESVVTLFKGLFYHQPLPASPNLWPAVEKNAVVDVKRLRMYKLYCYLN